MSCTLTGMKPFVRLLVGAICLVLGLAFTGAFFFAGILVAGYFDAQLPDGFWWTLLFRTGIGAVWLTGLIWGFMLGGWIWGFAYRDARYASNGCFVISVPFFSPLVSLLAVLLATGIDWITGWGFWVGIAIYVMFVVVFTLIQTTRDE